jgi:hypothetical protein
LLGSGSRSGTGLSSVVPCCPSKLEGRERTSGDDPVLAVPQPNTPTKHGLTCLVLEAKNNKNILNDS